MLPALCACRYTLFLTFQKISKIRSKHFIPFSAFFPLKISPDLVIFMLKVTTSFCYIISSENTLRHEHYYIAWFPDSQSKWVQVLTRPRLSMGFFFRAQSLHSHFLAAVMICTLPSARGVCVEQSCPVCNFCLGLCLSGVLLVQDWHPFWSHKPWICYSLTCAFASVVREFKLLYVGKWQFLLVTE